MTSELIQELKEAGFPQNGEGMYRDWFHEDDETGLVSTNSIYEPTLRELIDACGDIVLWKNGNKWCADLFNGKGELYIDDYFSPKDGSTPEIAVARLWLSLNKKV